MSYVTFYDAFYVFASLCALYRFKQLDQSSRVFAVYVWISSLNEIIGTYAAIVYHSNMPVYAFYCLIEFTMISIYFNSSIDVFKKNSIGYLIAMLGIIIGLINIIFIQGVHILTSYFLVFEGIFIIGMGLFSFFRLLLNDDQLQLYKYSHFWFTTILVFFWSITFITWALYDYFVKHHNGISYIIGFLIRIVGSIFYASIGCIFFLYPKMKRYE